MTCQRYREAQQCWTHATANRSSIHQHTHSDNPSTRIHTHKHAHTVLYSQRGQIHQMNRALEDFSEKYDFFLPEIQNGERMQGRACHAEAPTYYKNDL